MRRMSLAFAWCPRLFLASVVAAAAEISSAIAAPADPVTQAWAQHISGPTNTYLEMSGMSVGPSGDVFLAGHTRRSGYNHDIFLSRRTSSGALVWERRFQPPEGWSGDEFALGVVARGTNVYVVGSITSANETGSQDFLTLKYRDTGELEWMSRLDGRGHFTDQATAVAVDSHGDVLVLGNSVGTNGSIDIAVLKYQFTGNLLWTYSYDGPEHGADRSVGIRLDAADNIYVVGTTAQSSEPSSIVAFKLDPAGHELWLTREQSESVYGLNASSLDLDPAGRLAIVGSERAHCVTWKYDAEGNRQWMAHYRAEEPASMSGVYVRFDASGNLITAANLFGSGINDAVLIKYSVDGRQLWTSRFSHPAGPAHLNAFDVDGEGNAYLTTAPAYDVVTVKINPAGAQLWSVTYNSQGFFSDYGEFLEVTPSGDIYMAGRSTSFSDAFVSLVKYTQQPVSGIVTAVVRPDLEVVDPGADVLFSVETTGPGPSTYQWRMNGRAIPGETGPTLGLFDVEPFQRGDYSVVVSNLAGATVSPEARLSIRVPPEVSIAPTQTVAYMGTDAAFLATIVGNDFATLQWRRNSTPIPGATNEILRLDGLTLADSGAYDVVVSTFGGTTTSSAAGLKISRALELVGKTSHRSGPTSWDYTPQLHVLPTGDFLIVARSNYSGGANIVLEKHDAGGALVWASTYENSEFTNAEPARLLRDGAGNIYVAGLSRQPYLTAAWAVLKYAPNGQLLWSRILTGTNTWSAAHGFAVDAQGNSAIALLGETETKVVRYKADGTVQWSFIEMTPDNDTIAVAVDNAGQTYLGTTIRVAGGGDNEIRLRQFDATGSLRWTVPIADGHYNRLGALAVDSAGHPIVAGTGAIPDLPDSWMFVIKYSANGGKLWETRTGHNWLEISYLPAMAVGPHDEITVVTHSDDDYELGEQSGIVRIAADGRLVYHLPEPRMLVWNQSQLALDNFGNAYIAGSGGRQATGADAVTAKYDAYGNRPWMVYYDGTFAGWQYGLAVGVDAFGDVRVLATEGASSDTVADFSVLHYRQRDPASNLRLQLISDAVGTLHLSATTSEAFRIEASADLQNWSLLSEDETQRLLQPGSPASSRQRFFRLVLVE